MNVVSARNKKEIAVAYWKAIFQLSPGHAEENHGKQDT